MQFLRHSLIGLFLLSLTLAALAYAGYIITDAVQERMNDEPRAPDRREREFAVAVITAEEETLSPILTAFGEIESRRTLELRAKTGGTLTYLAEEFEEGGDVTRGQVLARIDPADAQSALLRAESDLLDAEAEVRDADHALELANDELTAARAQAELREKAYQRQLDLERRNVGTAAAVETAELSAAQARQAVLSNRQAVVQAEARISQAATRLSRTQIALEQAQRDLTDTTLVAEFDGTLADVSVVAGRVVSANEQLARLIDDKALEVAFRISTAQYARLLDENGALITAPVTITMTAYDLELTATGVITRDSAAVGEGQTGRVLFARLDKGNGMKPGDFVTVSIEEPPLPQVVRLPSSALGADGTVLVLSGESRLEALPVRLLRRQRDDILVRGDGLSGRDVVTERSPLLGEGIKVRVLNADTTSREEASGAIALTEERRARLIAYVEGRSDLNDAARTRLIGQLSQPQVPVGLVERLESRMGG